MSNSEIPVVSFAPFLTGTDKDQQGVAKQVYDALSTIGFIYLRDHGIPQSEVDAALVESRRFFSLPKDKKLKYKLNDAKVNQGYTPDGAEGINDHKECYEHRRFTNALCPSASDLAHFRTNVDHFYAQCLTLSLNVLRCLAIVMKLGDDFFDKITTKADPQLRLLHYPSIARSEVEKPGHSRIGAHTDFGLCTLLFQDSTGGLEIDPFHTGDFITAPPISGTCLINIGDLLMRFTNGRVKSTLHRVVSPSIRRPISGELNGNCLIEEELMLPDRYSIPFFVHPDPETLIDPIVQEEGEVKKYKAVRAGDWREYNTRRNYGLDGRSKTSLVRVEGEEDILVA